MRTPTARIAVLALCLLTTGCATRSLPKYEKPLARTPVQSVRTTAYTDSEGDHLRYTNHNACGDLLQSGAVHSAACDWSRWPVGTVFRIQETGENFIVDDYGWALSGTNTIDLYKPSRAEMNHWGTRRVNIELVQWGDVRRSLAILQPRAKHAHVRRMIDQIKSRYAELSRPLPGVPSADVAMLPPAAELAPALDSTPTARAVAVTSPAAPSGFVPPAAQRPPLTPFAASASR
jgi:3D (Asp-Asp-Asp) domain-containing protein